MTPPTGPVFLSLPGDVLNDTGGIEDELLLLLGKVEGFDVNKIAVRRGDSLQVAGDINRIDAFVIGGRLLTDVPFKRRRREILAALHDGRVQPFGRVCSVRRHRHIVFADMIKHAC